MKAVRGAPLVFCTHDSQNNGDAYDGQYDERGGVHLRLPTCWVLVTRWFGACMYSMMHACRAWSTQCHIACWLRAGGYAQLGHVHFVTQPAVVEAPCGSNAFGIVKLFSHKIEIDGQGSQVPDRILALQ